MGVEFVPSPEVYKPGHDPEMSVYSSWESGPEVAAWSGHTVSEDLTSWTDD